MNDEKADSEMVAEAGCKLFPSVCGGKNDSLGNLHYANDHIIQEARDNKP